MLFKKITLTVIGLALGTFVFGQESFDLQSAIDYALKNHSDIKKAAIAVEDAVYTSKEYKSIGMPKVNGKIGYNYFIKLPTSILPDFLSPVIDGKLLGYGLIQSSQLPPLSESGFAAQFGTRNNLSAGIEVGALLFDAQFFVGLEAQRMLKELYVKQSNITAYQVKNNVIKAYYNIMIAEANIGLIDKNIQNLKATLKEVSAINKAGFVEELDVDRISLAVQNLAVEKDKVVNFVSLGKNLLKFQMSYPMEKEITLVGDIESTINAMKIDLSVLNNPLTISKRPEYDAINTGLRLLDIKRRSIKAGFLPNIVGFGSFSYSLQRNNLFNKNENKAFPTSAVGVNVNIPIFDGYEKSSKLKRTALDIEKSKLQLGDFERAVQLETENARVSLKNAWQTVENAERSLSLAQKIYNTSIKKYKAGIGSSFEVVQSERDLFAAQSTRINALYQLINAKVDLDKAMGN